MYEYTGILLGAHPVLHISRIRVKKVSNLLQDSAFTMEITPTPSESPVIQMK
jgi:hypothetical protein